MKGILKVLLVWMICFNVSANNSENQNSSKPSQEYDQRWRIAYYQGGEYADYYEYLVATVNGLMELGWIEPVSLPDFPGSDTKALWRWMAQNVESSYLEFVIDGFYSVEWDESARAETRGRLISRLNHSKDIDMMMAMGTWAGQDLANNLHRIPTVVISASNPVGADIITSLDDSGFDHLFASYDPGLYPQQIQLFHKLVGFKKLGVPFENSSNGRVYAGMEIIEKAALELNFEVIPCYTKSDVSDLDEANRSVIKCFEELAPKVDAIYVSTQGGVNAQTTPELVRIANRNSVPTFSQNGEQEVRYGYMLSLAARGGIAPEGHFLAQNIGRIINGAKPRELKQLFDASSSVVLNMKTAENIGFYLNADLLAAADKLYWQIEQPE